MREGILMQNPDLGGRFICVISQCLSHCNAGAVDLLLGTFSEPWGGADGQEAAGWQLHSQGHWIQVLCAGNNLTRGAGVARGQLGS